MIHKSMSQGCAMSDQLTAQVVSKLKLKKIFKTLKLAKIALVCDRDLEVIGSGGDSGK